MSRTLNYYLKDMFIKKKGNIVRFVLGQLARRRRLRLKLPERVKRTFICGDRPRLIKSEELWDYIRLYFDDYYDRLIEKIEQGEISFNGYERRFSVMEGFRDRDLYLLMFYWNLLINLVTYQAELEEQLLASVSGKKSQGNQ